jgi:hypothetical protein
MPLQTRRAAQAFLLLLGLATLGGCSKGNDFGPTGKITGRLTMDGKPLPEKTSISFMEPMSGYLAYGQTDADGNYNIASWNNGEMPIGKYKVFLSAPPTKVDPASLSPEQLFEHPELAEGKVRLPFPKKYGDMNTSGLEYEIKAGENKFDVDIKGPEIKK